MGALFGYTGVRDDAFSRHMSSVLAHRGHASCDTLYAASAVLGVRAHANETHGGVHDAGDIQVALAGHLTTAVSPADIARMYRTVGLDALHHLRGGWVIAIVDGDTLHLARDGAGGRTLFYAVHHGQLLFASEPKAIHALPTFDRHIRAAAMAQYLSFSFVPGDGTMLDGLHEMKAGHSVTWRRGELARQQRWFRFEEPKHDADAPPQRSDSEWIRDTRKAVEQAVASRMPPAGEPVAVFLSGGLDSSIIASEVMRQRGRDVRTFAIHFGKAYPNELAFAREVADRIGSDHEEVFIQPRHFVSRLRHTVWHLDEPIGDPITSPNFELARHVVPWSPWVFNGEGGDPLFGGPKNLGMLLSHWYGGIERGPRFREQAYLASYRRGYEEISRMLSPDVLREIDYDRDLENLLTPFFEAANPPAFLNKLMAINTRLKGAHLILPKVERMTGAWGITPLSPLFDESLMELSFAMPPTLKLGGGIEKIALKRAFEDDLPRSVIERPKSGMRVPVHFWFQGEMRRYARKLLSKKALRSSGLYNEARVKQLLRYDTEEGPGRYGLRLWMLLTLEIWRRIVVEREPV